MTKTVIAAFNELVKEKINLDSDDTKKARKSRDWLLWKVAWLEDLPSLYNERHMNFGSFARNTKIRPLDDIDMLICLKANWATYFENDDWKIILTVPEGTNLYNLTKDNNNELSSIKVLNLFKKWLESISQYTNSDINRHHEAVVLNLSSYDWSFDIVACFFTAEDLNNRTYYIIPDWKGDWKKTDPRIDQKLISEINSNNHWNVLVMIRLTKFWSKKYGMPEIGSYLVENFVLKYYEYNNAPVNLFPDTEFIRVLRYIKDNLYNSVPDPKWIQWDLNTLDISTKIDLQNKLNIDIENALSAREKEEKNEYKHSIALWKKVLGQSFPDYE